MGVLMFLNEHRKKKTGQHRNIQTKLTKIQNIYAMNCILMAI